MQHPKMLKTRGEYPPNMPYVETHRYGFTPLLIPIAGIWPSSHVESAYLVTLFKLHYITRHALSLLTWSITDSV